MSVYDTPIHALDGGPLDLSQLTGKVTLFVNVASKCGLTPQYEALQQLHEAYADRGFSVVGVPCNQFGLQEPGDADEIATFCSSTYSVTFPITEKVDVNGGARHPLFAELTSAPDGSGVAGDIEWNFEKFLVSTHGTVVGRFRPAVKPDADEIVAAIESALPDAPPTWVSKPVAEVEVGDRIRHASGTELTVTRIEHGMLGRDNLMAFIEDSPRRWLKRPIPADGEIEVLVRQ